MMLFNGQAVSQYLVDLAREGECGEHGKGELCMMQPNPKILNSIKCKCHYLQWKCTKYLLVLVSTEMVSK